MQKSALVIGGSGMLSQVSVYFAEHDFKTIVVGRNKVKLDRLQTSNNNIEGWSLDYARSKSFMSSINELMQTHNGFDYVVSWIHGDDTELVGFLMLENTKHCSSKNWNFYHVLSSASDAGFIKTEIHHPTSCNYLQVQLGFKIEDDKSRWLTHNEISRGVIEAIEKKTNVLVGQVEPWDLRP